MVLLLLVFQITPACRNVHDLSDFLSTLSRRDKKMAVFLLESHELHGRTVDITGLESVVYKKQRKLFKRKNEAFLIYASEVSDARVKLLATLELINLGTEGANRQLTLLAQCNLIGRMIIDSEIETYTIGEVARGGKEHPVFRQYF